jgi:N-acetyl sugar amidotransferase
MDSSDPAIRFDSDGICSTCKEYEASLARLPKGEEKDKQLHELIDKIKREGANKKYDCIIGVSGGVDSTYVAYLAAKFRLRALAVHLDNGWNSELAVANIEKTLKTLGFELYTHVIDWEEFKDLQLAFLKASVTNVEIPTDHAITAILYRTAAAENIRYILTGVNSATEGITPSNWGESNKDLRLLKSIHRKFGTKALKSYPTISLFQYATYLFGRQIKYIPILDYVDYHREQAIETLSSALGWITYGDKHCESIFTRFFQKYLILKKFNVDKRLGHLSTMIISGQISRKQALEELSEPAYSTAMFESDYEYVLKKLGLSQQEFDAIMRLPIKTNRDYPSNDWIFRRLGGLIKKAKSYATA